MRIKDYIRDRFFSILMYIANTTFIVMMFCVFKVNQMLLGFVLFSSVISGLLLFGIDYHKRATFLTTLQSQLNAIEKKYLVHEMVEEPYTFDEKVLYECVQEINRCMINDMNVYKLAIDDFKQYLELWVHEIKIPLASARLVIENNKGNKNNALLEELSRVEKLVETVLFYAKSEYVEKDYSIKKNTLEGIVNKVIVEQRNQFISKHITLDKEGLKIDVNTDAKWMEFIISQIVANSLKYANKENAYIKIYAMEKQQEVTLYIEDNGIGINAQDLHRVFDKGFTGENGRMQYKSTGIGLYLCKNLCKKMHHAIHIESTLHEKTIIAITFPKSSMMNVIT